MANLVDFSQIIKAIILVDSSIKDCAMHPSTDSKNMIKHSILNSLRFNHSLHKARYGKMILACDSQSWRKGVFPEYKWKRQEAKKKDESGINWDFVFEVVNELLTEIQEYFPFIVLKVKGAEGDDIIAVITELLSNQDPNSGEMDIFGDREVEPILITSSDRDNFQLHKYKNVKQYSPMDKKLIKPTGPARHALIEKIVKGDTGDGVPNFRMGDDTFVIGTRQKPIATKLLEQFQASANPIDLCTTDEERKNFTRNERMVSYDFIPQDIKEDIIMCYNEYKDKKPNKMGLMTYFTKNRMNNLYSQIHDFF